MPEERDDDGRVVHSRPGGEAGEAARAVSAVESRLSAAFAGARGGLWRALLPLVVGFALIVSLVYLLGRLSRETVSDVRFDTQGEERALSGTLRILLDMRLALSRLDTEARLRARSEAGTRSVILPPSDLRLRTERGAVEELLPEFDRLPLKDEALKRDVRERVVGYVEITRDLERYSLEGFEAYRELDGRLRTLISGVTEDRQATEIRRDRTLEEVRGEIEFLMWLAVVTGLVVATATFLEVWRRFRQMRRGFEALRRERQFSAQMIEGMPSAVAALDGDDRIRSANASFFDAFPGAHLGASIHDKLAPPEGLKLLAAATSSRVSRSTYRGRWRLPGREEGRERVFDVYSSPLEIEGEDGQLLTLVDVTETAEAEQELRRQEALAAVGQAAAQVAHEIKNPLGSIRLGVAMLRDMTKDREAITTIDLVERGIEHLSKLTLDVTQFSRRRQLAPTDVDLHDLLAESLDLVTDKLRERQTPVERDFRAEPARGHWDEDQLRQVFVNLLANAADASPPGSPVTVATERTHLRTPDRRQDGEGDALSPGVRVVITDRGPGMDGPTRARIFEPFFTTKKKGTGLGLAIAKQIVEQHGGTINVLSRLGEGTSFVVDLPLSVGGL